MPLQSQTVLTAEQLAAIGCVAVESTYCELALGTIIASVLGISIDDSDLVLAGVGLDSKLELFRRLAKSRLSTEQFAELTAVLEKVKNSNSKRNTIIHGMWTTQAKNYLALLRDGPEKYPPAIAKKKDKTFSANDVMETANAISEARSELLEFCSRTWSEEWLKISL